MKRLIYISIIFPLLFACGKQNNKLETALRLAGDNRPELEKVLTHYSQSSADSLKLQAARFLIKNMPGHYTITGDKVDALRMVIDSDTTASYFLKKILDISICYMDEMAYGTGKLEDVRHIKADFLIHHIDRSFEKRDKLPWAKELPFELFLEHVLPYRFANERPNYWIDSIQMEQWGVEDVLAVNDKRYSLWNANFYPPIAGDDFPADHPLIMNVLRHTLTNECREATVTQALQSRIAAIPASTDFFPNYANRNGYHYWHSKRSPEHKNPYIANALERRSSKVYRITYSIQPHATPVKGEYVPDFFQNPFVKDVTDEYFHTADVRLKPIVSPDTPPRHAYLYTFCNLTWTPSAIGAYSPRSISFPDMGKNILYLPGYYHLRSIKAMNYPFLLRLDGSVDWLIPDTTQTLRARLDRKYPLSQTVYLFTRKLRPTTVSASNSVRFKDSDLLLSEMTIRNSYLEGLVDAMQPYRYWQVSIPRGVECAEIVFFDKKGKTLDRKVDEAFQKVADGDPLTNSHPFFKKNADIVFDFGRPVAVSRVVLLPRSDGNGIYPGDDYELFYHDLDGWQSLGRRVATDYFLDYDNLPAGALYWLHNHTRGVEERPFTITPSGDIRFW